ncbi:MAG: c-type cytochrome [Flavobacteriales bacterium]|nr:c-type cytochrome [Flavobacteriales bacterium]
MKLRVSQFLVLALFFGCDSDPVVLDQPVLDPEMVPVGFPLVDVPEDNAYSPERWLLGKKLFYDPVLSADYSISCASCHDPERAFAVNEKFSLGVGSEIGTRNSPSLANVAYHPSFTREGGVPSLEMQVLVPIQEHNEFNTNIIVIADRLNEDEEYIEMSRAAYGRLPDPFVITRAIANFERTLLSGNSRYDKAVFQNETGVLSPKEMEGLNLFFSAKTGCSDCHSGLNFTNYQFENNGLYADYPDVGRFRLTTDSSDIARFKVPSLRNIALTYPYMHDGSFQTLKDVINHYNMGGENHPNKSEKIRVLNLKETEVEALEAFLLTLTDNQFVHNKLYQDE